MPSKYIFVPKSCTCCIWGIPAEIDLAVNLTIFVFFPSNMLSGVQKKYRTWSFRCKKKFFEYISPKIPEKTEDDTIGPHQFGWNLDSKFYVTNKFLSHRWKWARPWFETYEKIKIKKKKFLKRKLLNMMVPNFLYNNSYYFLPLLLLLWAYEKILKKSKTSFRFHIQ